MGTINIKRKLFFAPAVATAGKVLLNGATVASVPLMGGQMLQSHNQAKEAAEQAEKQAEQAADLQKAQERDNKKMREKMDAQNKALEKIASSGSSNMGQQAASVLKGFSSHQSEEERCFGGVYNWQNIKGFAKELGSAAWQRKGILETGIAFAAPTAIVGYGVDKVIQHDKAKDGDPVEGTRAYNRQMQQQQAQMQQRSYAETSVLATIGSGAKEIGSNIIKNHKMSLGIGSVLAALPLATHYAGKAMQGKQANQTAEQRSYAISFGSIGKTIKGWGNSIKKGWNSFNEDKLGSVSSLLGGGNRKDVDKFSGELLNSKNPLTQKFGNWIGDHKAIGVLGSAGLGTAAFAGTDALVSKPIKAGLKAVDKDAFAYERSQQQQIQ